MEKQLLLVKNGILTLVGLVGLGFAFRSKGDVELYALGIGLTAWGGYQLYKVATAFKPKGK